MATTVTERLCLRCQHRWLPRKAGTKPLLCPKCGSAGWDRPKEVK